MSMNHKQKKTLARKLLSIQEVKDKTPIFESKAWNDRKDNIHDRVKRNEQKNKDVIV